MAKQKKSNYSKYKDALKNRQNTKTSEKVNQGFGILDLSSIDAEFYKPKKGNKNKIESIPWVCTTDKSPNEVLSNGDVIEINKDDIQYMLDIWVHRGLGVDNKATAICLAKTYQDKCPICEDAHRQRQNGADKDDVNHLYPQHRVIYQILDKNEPDKGLQIFNISFNCFEKELREDFQSYKDEEGEAYFSDMEEGLTIKFKASEESFKGNKYMDCKAFQFIERKKPLDMDLFENAIPLESLLIILTYEELLKLHDDSGSMSDSDDDDSDEEEKSKKKKRTVKKEESNSSFECPKCGEEYDDEDDADECCANANSDNENNATTFECSECNKQYDDEDDADECCNSNDNSNEIKCESGGTIGEDFNQLGRKCKNCDEVSYDKCSDLYDEIQAKQTKKKKRSRD